MLKVIELFAGIGAQRKALQKAGHNTVKVRIEAYKCSIPQSKYRAKYKCQVKYPQFCSFNFPQFVKV